MAAHVAQIDQMDQSRGRMLGSLENSAELDKTLHLYFQDNGGCADGGMFGGGVKEQILNGCPIIT